MINANKKIIIFGIGDVAELALYYFTNDTQHSVVGFTIDEAYMETATFCGLPVITWEKVQSDYSPSEYSVFVGLGYSKVNALRKVKFDEVKAAGYDCVSYVSSKATILNDGKIGENCFILEDNTIQPFVEIGNNVTMWSGNHVGHHTTIASHCFLASHIVVSGRVKIGEACFLGVNATLRDHITVGEKCVIGAGTLLLADAEPNGVYIGTATERSRVPSNRLRKI